VSSSGYFGISLLAAHQKEISDRFAGRHNELSNRFEGIQIFHMVSGTPLISDSLSVFDCKTISSIPSGTHTIFIGEVLAARQLNHGLPLIYFDRDYREIKT
jgi:flavin reductase (DIM6/NTAB) family NADH-FMN oxidoreductase RutF